MLCGITRTQSIQRSGYAGVLPTLGDRDGGTIRRNASRESGPMQNFALFGSGGHNNRGQSGANRWGHEIRAGGVPEGAAHCGISLAPDA